jgi:tetratricopeptide (TPR) repeat protein
LAFSIGLDEGVARAEAVALKENVSLTPDVRDAIEQGMNDLLENRGKEAAAQFQSVKAMQPALSSLSILTARAALQAGDLALAQQMVDEALAARESISEALTMQALIEARLAISESFKSMGNPRLRIEQLLQRAIAADVTDPRPFIELAVLRRFERKFDEAHALLEAAKARQSSSNDRLALDISLELLTLQQLDDESLRNRGDDSFHGLSAPLLRAYRALRLDDSATAEASLAMASATLPTPTLKQCLRDPAFVAFGKSPLLQSYLNPPQPESHD